MNASGTHCLPLGTTLAALQFPGTLRTILFDVSGSSISKKETTTGEAAERNGEPGSRSQRLFSLVPSPVIATMWVREQSVTPFKKCWVRLGVCVQHLFMLEKSLQAGDPVRVFEDVKHLFQHGPIRKDSI